MDWSACLEHVRGSVGPLGSPRHGKTLAFSLSYGIPVHPRADSHWRRVLQSDCGHVLCGAGHNGHKADQRKLRRFKAQAAKIRRGAIELLKQQKRNLMARLSTALFHQLLSSRLQSLQCPQIQPAMPVHACMFHCLGL